MVNRRTFMQAVSAATVGSGTLAGLAGAGTSSELALGDVVVDPEGDRQTQAVVVAVPEEMTISDWEYEIDGDGTETSVAAENPSHDPDEQLVVVCFKTALQEVWPDWAVAADEGNYADLLIGAADHGVHMFGFPESRLDLVQEEGDSTILQQDPHLPYYDDGQCDDPANDCDDDGDDDDDDDGGSSPYIPGETADYHASSFGHDGTDYSWVERTHEITDGDAPPDDPDEDVALIWVHGWTPGDVFSSSSDSNTHEENLRSTNYAFDAIRREAGYEEGDAIGYIWNSGSKKVGFSSAVETAEAAVPSFVAFLEEVTDKYDEVHIGAHSLGCWLTLDGLAFAVHADEPEIDDDVIKSVNLVCGAVPSTAVDSDPFWTLNLDEPYEEFLPDIVEKVNNHYYPGDQILQSPCTGAYIPLVDTLSMIGNLIFGTPPTCGPFGYWMEYDMSYSGSSFSSAALGYDPEANPDLWWENKQLTDVSDHSDSYKHPDFGSDAGGAQGDIWPPDTSEDTGIPEDEEDDGSDCEGSDRCKD